MSAFEQRVMNDELTAEERRLVAKLISRPKRGGIRLTQVEASFVLRALRERDEYRAVMEAARSFA